MNEKFKNGSFNVEDGVDFTSLGYLDLEENHVKMEYVLDFGSKYCLE